MEELLTPLTFPQLADRPYFLTSFVSTIDGKIFVNRPGYWPIGSRNDYNYFTFLRAHADVIIEGKNTALKFAKHTIETIHRADFLAYRQKLGKTKPIKHLIVTSRVTDELVSVLKNTYQFRPIILTTDNTAQTTEDVEIVPLSIDGGEEVDMQQVVDYLVIRNMKTAFLDMGPTMFMSFLEKKWVDEVFLTIAPKIVGNIDNEAITLGEGSLFGAEFVPQFTLAHVKQVENEVFLRYRRSSEVK